MRRTGSFRWWLAGTVLAALSWTGCADDPGTGVVGGEPTLTVRGYTSCDVNSLPVVTNLEIVENTMETAKIDVSGADPARSSGDITPGTKVRLYVGNAKGLPGGEGGAFMSTVGTETPSGSAKTGPLEFASSTVSDNFFCKAEGIKRIYAYVENYGDEKKLITVPLNEGYPIRCVPHDKWMCDCKQICPVETDAPLPDALPPDALTDALPTDAAPVDAAPVDAAAPDADLGPDRPVPPPTWQVTFHGPQTEDDRILRVRGRSGNDTASEVFLQWKVSDNGRPREGIRVDFAKELPGMADYVVSPLFGYTDVEGLVGTLLQAGDTPGQVVVRATADLPNVPDEDQNRIELSPPITIDLGLPSLNNFSFDCQEHVLASFGRRLYNPNLAPDRRGDYWTTTVNEGTTCFVELADKRSRRVAVGTPVRFMTEAGTVGERSVTDGGGLATTVYGLSQNIPVDVPPAGYEVALGFVIPFREVPDIVFNPRDGLVRLVAATTGDEGFTDNNGNAAYDLGTDTVEPGDSVGDPFVDANDNFVRDAGEDFIDADGIPGYTPADGGHQSNVTIWKSTAVLWVGMLPLPGTGTYDYFGPKLCDVGPGCPHGCLGDSCSFEPEGGCAGADFYFQQGSQVRIATIPRDLNGNCLDSRGKSSVTLDVRLVDPGPEVEWVESGSGSVDFDTHLCTMDGTMETPAGGGYARTLRMAAPDPPAGENPPPPQPVYGVITYSTTYELANGDEATDIRQQLFCAFP